jgi:hypothetical protein
VLEAVALEEEPVPLEQFVEDVDQYCCSNKEEVRQLLEAFKQKAGLDGGRRGSWQGAWSRARLYL